MSLKGIGNIAGCNFFVLVSLFKNQVTASLLTFQLEKEVFIREQANNLYNPSAYFIAKNVIEIPGSLITPMLQLLVMYWGVGYNGGFLQLYLVMLLIVQTSMGIGLVISSLASNMTSANAMAPLFTLPMILFGGFVVNAASIPKWLGWILLLSPIRYANEAFAHIQFDGIPGLPTQYLDL